LEVLQPLILNFREQSFSTHPAPLPAMLFKHPCPTLIPH
jgi:hypothetical protein